MITVFSDFSAPPIQTCSEVYFASRGFGGEASFVICGESKVTTIGVAGGETTFPYCIVDGTLSTIGDITTSIVGPCGGGPTVVVIDP